MERLALRLGYQYRPGARPQPWDELQPVELFALQDARQWRRNRDWEMVTLAVARLRDGLGDTDVEAMLNSLGGYEPAGGP
jgi:hypothetical protein